MKEAGTNGRMPFDEVALYGAQIHAVVPSAEELRKPVRKLLEAEGIHVDSIEWIVPTLEDVFISTVNVSAGRNLPIGDNGG